MVASIHDRLRQEQRGEAGSEDALDQEEYLWDFGIRVHAGVDK
jgi:hypothetical protein